MVPSPSGCWRKANAEWPRGQLPISLHNFGIQDLFPVVGHPKYSLINTSLCSNQTIRKTNDQHLSACTILPGKIELTTLLTGWYLARIKVPANWYTSHASYAHKGQWILADHPQMPQVHPQRGTESMVQRPVTYPNSVISHPRHTHESTHQGSSGWHVTILPAPRPIKATSCSFSKIQMS